MNLVKIADMLKSASDQNLIQEIQNPTGSVPSYMVLSELDRRKKLRGSLMNGEPQTSVAEDMQAEQPVNQMGIGAFQPQVQPQMQPQGYADGGEVDYQDDLPWEERMRRWREMTGFGRMAPQAAAKPAVAPEQPVIPATTTAPARQPQAGAQPRPTGGVPAAPRQAAAAPAQTPTLSPEAQDVANAREAGLEGLKSYNEYMKQAIEENKASKAENAGYALMQAGLGIMGGRSPYAFENIGQGAAAGMQQFMGMEQARQKQGQALAMDMASSGMKKAEMLSNLAKLGYTGKEAEAKANQALAMAKYYTAGAGAMGIKGAGSSDKLDVQEIKALRSDYTKRVVDPMFEQKYPTFESYLGAMGYTGSRGPSGGGAASNVPTYNPQTRSWQ